MVMDSNPYCVNIRCVSSVLRSLLLCASCNQKKKPHYALCAGYMVEKREKGMTMWTKANNFSITDCNVTINNLAENSEYEFRIVAVNAAGTSDPSLPCASVKIKEKVGQLYGAHCDVWSFVSVYSWSVDHLDDLVVMASASRAEDPGFESRL